MYEEDEPTPPLPKRHPTKAGGWVVPRATHIDEETRLGLPLWKAILGAVTIATASISGWRAYDGIQQSIRTLDTRMQVVDGKLTNSDPAKIRDQCREMVRDEMKRTVVECPKRVVKGEVVSKCAIVIPKE